MAARAAAGVCGACVFRLFSWGGGGQNGRDLYPIRRYRRWRGLLKGWVVPTMPTRELYMQGTQEQQLPGIEPPPGRLKTSTLTIGPSMSLAHRAAQLAQGAAFMGGHIQLGLRKQPYRLKQVRDGGGRGQTTEMRRPTGLKKPKRNRMPLATRAPVQQDKTRGVQEGRTLEAGGGGGADMQGPRQRLQGLYVPIRLICSTPVCVACLRFFDGCSHRGEAGLTQKTISWVLSCMHPEKDRFQSTSEA